MGRLRVVLGRVTVEAGVLLVGLSSLVSYQVETIVRISDNVVSTNG